MTSTRPTSYSLFADNGNLPVADNGNLRIHLLNIAETIRRDIHRLSSPGDVRKLWLVAVHSPLRFAAAVIACWQSRVIPVLSADLQPDTLAELSQSLSGILTDGETPVIGGTHALHPSATLQDANNGHLAAQNDALGHNDSAVIRRQKAVPNGAEPSRTVLASAPTVVSVNHDIGVAPDAPSTVPNPTYPADDTAMVLFTSGSSGQKKRVDKPFFALFEEVKNLETVFGNQVAGLPRRTTVSHFHIYGFLFNILWPLHAGRLLSSPTTFYWEQILQTGEDGACIISSPAHLRVLSGIAPSHPFNWNRSVIFSSGGPLDRAIAVDILNVTGHAPIEIFGSTETGGIGRRQQSSAEKVPFLPFAGVSVRKNHQDGLEVVSPWLHPRNQWMETGDRISFSPHGAFFPEGRYDTVVKIAGKRISLTEMETVLRDMPEIENARVFQYCDEDKASRAVLAAVVIPAAGHPIPTNRQRQDFIRTVKDRMRRRFDLVALPRYWRFVPDFPRNTEGKVPLSLLMETVRNGR